MKTTRRINKLSIIYVLAAMSCYFVINGYHAGPAANGYDCTGAETGLGNPTGCSCHGSAVTGIGVTIELDSVGVPTTHYVGGMSYTVKISGINNTTTSLPKFGFQLGSILGTAAMTTPTNAGTWSTSCPPSTHYSAPSAGNYVVGLVEQSTALTATTGTGGNGSTYVETFNWTAPVASTGTISFWGALNAVNGTGSSSGDKYNINHVAISEWPATNAVSSIESINSDINVFPNPTNDRTTISYQLASNFVKGEIRITDINGNIVETLPVSNGSTNMTVDCTSYAQGVYFFTLIVNKEIIGTKQIVKSN